MRLNIPADKFIKTVDGKPSVFPYPANLAGGIPKATRQRMLQWLQKNYIWPQIQQRKPFEEKWDKLLNMAKATWKMSNLPIDPASQQARDEQDKVLRGVKKGDRADVADTVIFDAIDRLTNLNHYVSFKEELPMQYGLPTGRENPYKNAVYTPDEDYVRAQNVWLKFQADQTNFYRKHWMQSRHHYTYGVSFAICEFNYEVSPVKQRNPQTNKFEDKMMLTAIGTTFEGMSIRKLWLNTQLQPQDMRWQPCPFFYEEVPRFAILAKPYDATNAPFGYANLDILPKGQWKQGAPELESAQKALEEIYPGCNLQSLCAPEYETELKWVLYPMMPFAEVDLQQLQQLPQEVQQQVAQEYENKVPETGKVCVFADGLPLKRYIMEYFGCSLVTGNVEMIRCQENFYPYGDLPIFGSSHFPDLDSGLYGSAIGAILESHYEQIVRALNQYLDNKDRLNDPPAHIITGSPALNQDINAKGARIEVNGPNDISTQAILDATGTTPNFIGLVREQAKTATKAVDSILGQAMGARTTATEAGNVFQTAMSGVVTEVNLFNHDMSGEFADRVNAYTIAWVDPDIFNAVTGSNAFQIKPEHFAIRLTIQTNVGSRFIERLTRQGHYRYILESSKGDPNINSGEVWAALLTEWGIPGVEKIVLSRSLESEVKQANDQATKTYLGELVMVDPDQDHAIAMKVKLSYLKDRNSVWNTRPEFAINATRLVEQIKQHQLFLQMQQLQQLNEQSLGQPQGGDQVSQPA